MAAYQVPAIATHGLNKKHASLRAHGRLLNHVTNRYDLIKSSVTSNAEIGSRHVVADGCWQANHWNTKLFVDRSLLGQLK